jgi:hypothetical protein
MDMLMRKGDRLTIRLGLSRLFLSQVSVSLGFAGFYSFMEERDMEDVEMR